MSVWRSSSNCWTGSTVASLACRGCLFHLLPQRWDEPFQLVQRSCCSAHVLLRHGRQQLIALNHYRAGRVDPQFDLIFAGLEDDDLDLVTDGDAFVYFACENKQGG